MKAKGSLLQNEKFAILEKYQGYYELEYNA